MNYYTSMIPFTLAEKLKEKGMPIKEDIYLEDDGYWEKTIKSPNYAEVFDWLIEKEMFITIKPIEKNNGVYSRFEACIDYNYLRHLREEECVKTDTWHEAAEAAIEKALTLK